MNTDELWVRASTGPVAGQDALDTGRAAAAERQDGPRPDPEAGRRVLIRFGVAMAALAPLTLLLAAVDDRTVLGVDTWFKPAKFFLSIAIYALTLAWAFRYLTPERATSRAARSVVRVTVVAGTLEQAVIVARAALAQQSHFNVATPLDAGLYYAMGLGAVLLVSTAAVTGVQVRRSRLLPPARLLGWSSGLLLSGVLGGLTGAVMGSGTSHLVGSDGDDRTGLPFLGWSTSVGDLRIAHFLALHAMLVLPLVGWLTHRLVPGRVAVAATAVAALTWTLVVVAVLANALAGNPL